MAHHRGARWSYLLATAALFTFSFVLRAVRWRVLLNAEARLGLGQVFWANMAGYLGNNFLPARAGELVRTILISSRSSLSKTYVLTTALSERLMDVIALVLGSSLVLLRMDMKVVWMENLSSAMALAAGAGGIAIMALPHTGGLLERALHRFPMPAGIRSRAIELLKQVMLGLRAFHDWGRFAAFILLTVAVWVADAFSTMTGAAALGIVISFPMALLLLAGLGIGSSLPSTPGYVGVFQFVAVTILTPFGISRDAALAYIFVYQAVSYVVVLAFGLPGLFQFRRSTPANQAILSQGARASD